MWWGGISAATIGLVICGALVALYERSQRSFPNSPELGKRYCGRRAPDVQWRLPNCRQNAGGGAEAERGGALDQHGVVLPVLRCTRYEFW